VFSLAAAAACGVSGGMPLRAASAAGCRREAQQGKKRAGP